MPDSPGLWDYFEAFPTTLDQTAWMLLVFMFELETYSLPDRFFTRTITVLLKGIRAACYFFVFYAVFGYGNNLWKLYQTTPYPEETRLCELADGENAFQVVLDYETITPENCEALDAGEMLYKVHTMDVVSGRPQPGACALPGLDRRHQRTRLVRRAAHARDRSLAAEP